MVPAAVGRDTDINLSLVFWILCSARSLSGFCGFDAGEDLIEFGHVCAWGSLPRYYDGREQMSSRILVVRLIIRLWRGDSAGYLKVTE